MKTKIRHARLAVSLVVTTPSRNRKVMISNSHCPSYNIYKKYIIKRI